MAENDLPTGPIRGAGIGTQGDAIALRPKNWEELWNFATLVSKTDFVPQTLRGNAGAVLAAVQMGHEVGLPPMASLRWIAVVKGVPTIWGDGFWSLIKSSALCEWTTELGADEALTKGYGECTIKRRGDPTPVTRRFTVAMAEKAGLLKDSDMAAWNKYRGRMLQMRARMLAGRDAIPEATGGLSIREEVLESYPDALPSEDSKPIPLPRAIDAPTPPPEAKTDPSAEAQKATAPVDTETSPGLEKPEAPAKQEKVSPGKKAKPQAQDDAQESKILELIEWIANASEEDLFAEPNHVLTELKAVKGTAAQMRVLRPYNDRRQAVQAAPGFGE